MPRITSHPTSAQQAAREAAKAAAQPNKAGQLKKAKAPGQAQIRDGVDQARVQAPGVKAGALQSDMAGAAAQTGLSAMASLPTGRAADVPLPMLARVFGMDGDASPSVEVMAGLAKLESAALGLAGNKEGLQAKLLVSGEKIREGMMLSLSDATGKYAGKGTKVDRGLVDHTAELIDKNLSLTKAESADAAKLAANIKGSLAAQQGRFPLGMDIQAFVQAVLRESYMLQNEQLRDFAEKVKYYNDLKKSIRAKKAAAMEKTEEPPLMVWDIDDGEWAWWDLPALEIEGDGPGGNHELEDPNAPGPMDGPLTQDTSPVTNSGTAFDPTQPAGVPEGVGFKEFERGEVSLQAGWLFDKSGNLNITGAGDLSTQVQHWNAWCATVGNTVTDELLRDAVPLMGQYQFEAVLNLAITDDHNNLETLAAIIEAASPAQLAEWKSKGGNAYYLDLFGRWGGTGETSFSQMELKVANLNTKTSKVREGLEDFPRLDDAISHYAAYLLEPTDANLDRVKAEMFGMSSGEARAFLKAVADNPPAGPSSAGNKIHALLICCDPAKLFPAAPADWAFLRNAGGNAADFYDRWVADATDEALAVTEAAASQEEQPSSPPAHLSAAAQAQRLQQVRHGPSLEATTAGSPVITGPQQVAATWSGPQAPGSMAAPKAGDPETDAPWNDDLAPNDPRNPFGRPDGEPPEGASRQLTDADREAYIKALEDSLNTVGDDAQLANVDLQNALQAQQQTLQMMSNISKMLHDTAMSIIRKLGG